MSVCQFIKTVPLERIHSENESSQRGDCESFWLEMKDLFIFLLIVYSYTDSENIVFSFRDSKSR